MKIHPMMKKYFTKYKCVKCDNVEDESYKFLECCSVCGNNKDYYHKRFHEVVGYWKTIKTPVRRKFLCFWWVGYKTEKIFVRINENHKLV